MEKDNKTTRNLAVDSASAGSVQPITTAPNDGSNVLVWLPIGEVWTTGNYEAHIGYEGHYFGDDAWEIPTHWMPMPPAPNS